MYLILGLLKLSTVKELKEQEENVNFHLCVTSIARHVTTNGVWGLNMSLKFESHVGK